MGRLRRMLESHPEPAGSNGDEARRCIEACAECAQACTVCADAYPPRTGGLHRRC
jgi:hypothetical protein